VSKFDAKTVALAGTNLIEASAGTGKTYTLAELYLRLVMEQDLTVDKILVVTYTRAATEELRDRLRQKLVDARDELIKGDATLLSKGSVPFYKLTLAIQSFDQAAIYTIHGVCQRVLTDFAFESGLRFDVSLMGDEVDILQSVTDDFWRCEVHKMSDDFSAYLLSRSETPETLLKSVRSLIGKPYLHYLPLPEIDLDRFHATVNEQFKQVKAVWLEEQDHVVATLQNKELLNGNKYRKTSVEKWLIQLAAMLQLDSVPAKLMDNFDRFTPTKLEDALKKGQQLPELTFWSACELLMDAQTQLQTARDVQLQNLRLALLSYINQKVPEQKQQQQVQSYDDLLINLERALNAEQGDVLVEQLREQYQAALIDEFQDTDQVQYDSFSRIYAKSGLPTFYVGDPKQAIYSFRGADVFTYLHAKSEAEIEHTLGTNWRSHPHLVTAVNSLFERRDKPFVYEQIPFIAVGAAREQEPALQVDEGDDAAMQLLWAASAKAITKKDMGLLAATATANEIARLLNLAQQGKARLKVDEEFRALSGGDIAVLVRNHRQAQEIQQSLHLRGINSVQQGRENVFATPEAMLLERLLLAVAEPNNESRVCAVLISPLFGLSAADLYELQQQEQDWLQQLDFFHDLHQMWLKQGFMTMFRYIMVAKTVQQRLLAMPNGERRLTNLTHLAELIQDFCSRQKSTIDAVLNWLASHRLAQDGDDETAQLRLESDEQLVKIITIHKSKGLEYPIVFCPYLWNANLRSAKDDVVRFHDPEHNNAAHVAFVEPALTYAREQVQQEELAEDLRLLYVALTRARERCIIAWGAAKSVEDSALFQLLHPTISSVDNAVMSADMQQLADNHAPLMSVTALTEQARINLTEVDDDGVQLAARKFAGNIARPWRIGSFSALTAGHDAELPDYDAYSAAELKLQAENRVQHSQDRFGFPRGAQAGTCLHTMFELWDFNVDDQAGLQHLVTRTLSQYGFEQRWQPVVCQWLTEIVNTRFSADSDFCLASLQPAQRLDEMSFYFPVAQLSVTKLKQQLLPHLNDGDVLQTLMAQLDFYDLTGFMKGFIDLVYEDQGRFYVVDYKSNFLGYVADDYDVSALDEAMLSHAYPLQYLIYSLALHRYLRLRVPDYDPDLHFGGVYYLFLRGMHPEWGQSGVYADRPSATLLDALDALLQGNES